MTKTELQTERLILDHTEARFRLFQEEESLCAYADDMPRETLGLQRIDISVSFGEEL